ncbi:MAG: protein kinase, partial [Gemmatimonadota bacterium]|nr:protein kinase [Gemmatimonadota bacterium]
PYTPPDLARLLARALGPQYQLGAEIGRGGMGGVYRATDLTLRRDVAVKVLSPDLIGHRAVVERFLAEARIIARLRHPNIVPVHVAGETDGLVYFVMDFVAGQTLRQRIQQEGKLDEAMVARIAADIASALEAAAEAGVVHRDLKPENILLEGSGPRALLTDFGVARILEGGGPATGPGVAMGTPAYMSPEQASGEPVDIRSDLYSLGVVCYEMLAGRPPFEGPPQTLLSRQILDPPVPIEERRPGISPALATAIMGALEKIPEARYQSPAEFRTAVLAHQPITPPGATPRSSLPRRRRTRALMVAAVALLVTVAAWLIPDPGPPDGINPRLSVMVLPFDNLRDDSELAWLRDGSVSMLTLALGQWHDLTVVDADRLHDLMAEAGPTDGPVGLQLARRLARQAGAWTVVLGEYTRQGDSLVLVARTYDVASGNRVDLSQVAGAGAADVRPLFDELARRLLSISAGQDARIAALSAVTTWSLEAYRAYLRGASHLHRWELAEAEADLHRAIAQDSSFALAYFRLSLTRGWRYGEADTVAMVAIEQAARYADRLPERERVMITAYRAMIEGDPSRSEALYGQLLARDSTDADAWYGLGDALFHDPGRPYAVAQTLALRAFRHAIRLDPRYVLAYEHVNAILADAASGNPKLVLVSADSLAPSHSAEGGALIDEPTLRAGVVRARAEAVAVAQSWVDAQPRTPRARLALFSVYLAAENHPAALQEAARIREILPESERGFASFLEARARFNSGDAGSAGRAIREGMLRLHPTSAGMSLLGTPALQDVLAGANILAYLGDVRGAAQLIALADTVRRVIRPPESGPGHAPSGLDETWEWARQAQLYSAVGGARSQLEAIWQQVVVASRSATPSQRQALARSVAAAPIGLFLLSPSAPAPLRELERMSGMPSDPTLLALEALYRGDSVQARKLLLTPPEAESETEAGEPSLWGFANGDPRPLTAEVLFQLGEYQATVDLLRPFQPDQLMGRQFDPRWAVLGRVRLLRGLALERLGQRAEAAQEFAATLAQWREADNMLLPLIDEARAGLARVRGSGTG